MNILIFDNVSMVNNYESDWIDVFDNNPSNFGIATQLSAIHFSWTSVGGSTNSNIEIYGANDYDLMPVKNVYNLPLVLGQPGSVMIFIRPLFRLLRIKYFSNGNTSGKISASAWYSKI